MSGKDVRGWYGRKSFDENTRLGLKTQNQLIKKLKNSMTDTDIL